MPGPLDNVLKHLTERWLTGGLGLVPLAPIGEVRQEDLPAVISGMKRRLHREPRGRAGELWSATNILMGLRYGRAFVRQLLKGVRGMTESDTYLAILEEGETKGVRETILLLGQKRFGDPSSGVVAALDALTDLRTLKELSALLLQASSWQELLGLNGPGRRRRGRKKAP